MSNRIVFAVLFLLFFGKGVVCNEEEDAEVVEDPSPSPETDEVVITLGQDNFTEYIQDKPIILVEFYAPWCGHCKQLAPEYEAAAEKLREHSIPLAKVDATAHEELSRKYEVQGFPTMKVFRKGTAYEYEGPRKADGIVEYMLKQASPDWEPPKDRVVVLTSDNFTEVVEENDITLVEFYAPWCGHCKRLAPEYTKAANLLHEMGSNVILAKVDGTAEEELGQRFEVQGFPTLKIFRRGRVTDYNGPRESRGIAQYMVKQSMPPTVPLGSTKEITKNLKLNDPMIVGFFVSPEDSNFLAYSDAANEARDLSMTLLHCSDPAIAKAYNIEFGTVAIFMPRQYHNKHEDKIKLYKGPYDISPKELLDKLKEMAAPLVGMRTKNNAPVYYTKSPFLVGYLSQQDEEDSFGHWQKKFLPLALKYPDIQFALCDEVEFKEEIKELQLGDRGDDLLVGLFASPKEKYAYEDEEVSTDSLEDFIEAYKAGDLKPVKKSQAPPTKQTGPVRVVVAETFKEIVEDPSKDVLIEFYAPWCGHCKALEPIYASLAKKFKKNDKLVIAKMDATANEFPEHYQVSGFPTIYFVPAGEDGTPVLYEGKREVKDMAKFLKKHATFSLGDTKKKQKKKAKEEL